MEGLFSFLIIAGLFFLMMRFGCGAHMAQGGHDQHGGHSVGNEDKHTDPVCGMKVDTNQGYGKMHAGKLYRFCSRDCLDQFDEAPVKYLNSPAEIAGGGS